MDIKILPIGEHHVSSVAKLECICFSDPWSENSIRGELNHPYSVWLVAEVNGDVVGYIGSQIAVDEADIMNVAVAPSHRRCGIGQMLIDELVEKLKGNGVVALMLEVRASNDSAISLYEKNGFSCVGVRPNYYFHPREDARIMRKEFHLTLVGFL